LLQPPLAQRVAAPGDAVPEAGEDAVRPGLCWKFGIRFVHWMVCPVNMPGA
jgi:hypothetical protein